MHARFVSDSFAEDVVGMRYWFFKLGMGRFRRTS